KLQNQSFVLSRFSFPLLGVLPRRKKRPFEKTIRRLEGDPETDFESAARVAAQNLLAVAADRKVCVVSSLGAKEVEPLVPYLNERVAICGDILRDVGAVKSLDEYEGIVLVEERERSRIDQIEGEVLHAEALGKKVLGIILM
ncbi:MAG: hypothetical protein II713_01960, partial [Clostridia bacterium]|nr:hypothetical protein [Clostridia bacterium]